VRLPVILMFLSLVLFCGTATAMLVSLTETDLDALADVIVVGTVTGTSSAWDDSRTAIFTDVFVAPGGFVKGSADRVVVRIPGGETEDIGMWVEDMPVFSAGDQVRLRLARTGEPGLFQLVGGMARSAPEGVDARPLAYYSYSGYHRSEPYCNYHINNAVPSDWFSPVQNGGAAWNGAGSAFRFSYAGTAANTGPTYDGVNIVCAANLGAGGILAQNTFWYTRKGKIVLENDIVFNTYYPWSTTGAPGYYDVQNIATHELGHSLVLDDLYKSYQAEMTMYGYAAAGETKKRTLEFGDRDGIVKIYGAGDRTPGRASPSVD